MLTNSSFFTVAHVHLKKIDMVGKFIVEKMHSDLLELVYYNTRDYTGTIDTEETSLPIPYSGTINLTLVRHFPEDEGRDPELVKITLEGHAMTINTIETPEVPLGLIKVAKYRWLLVCESFLYDLDCRTLPIEINEIEKRKNVEYIGWYGVGWTYQEGTHISFWYVNHKRYDIEIVDAGPGYKGIPLLQESGNLYTVEMSLSGAHLCKVVAYSDFNGFIINGPNSYIRLFINSKAKLEVMKSSARRYTGLYGEECRFRYSDGFCCPSLSDQYKVAARPVVKPAKSART